MKNYAWKLVAITGRRTIFKSPWASGGNRPSLEYSFDAVTESPTKHGVFCFSTRENARRYKNNYYDRRVFKVKVYGLPITTNVDELPGTVRYKKIKLLPIKG